MTHNKVMVSDQLQSSGELTTPEWWEILNDSNINMRFSAKGNKISGTEWYWWFKEMTIHVDFIE